MTKCNPMVAVMSPRDIQWIEENFPKIFNYVDLVWFKYYNLVDVHKEIEKYFRAHIEYTHLILISDDGRPQYESVAMLIADVEKYDFSCVAGVVENDNAVNDIFLGITFEPVAQTETEEVTSKSYNLLPHEFLELQGIIKIWFEGNALHMMRRDVVEKVGLTFPRTAWWSEAGDLALSYQIAKAGIPQYCDLRILIKHYKDWHYTLVGHKPPCIKEVKATALVPKCESAQLVESIPDKYLELSKTKKWENKTF